MSSADLDNSDSFENNFSFSAASILEATDVRIFTASVKSSFLIELKSEISAPAVLPIPIACKASAHRRLNFASFASTYAFNTSASASAQQRIFAAATPSFCPSPASEDITPSEFFAEARAAANSAKASGYVSEISDIFLAQESSFESILASP